MSLPSLETTPIPGLLVVRLKLHEDSRGWFKENWQRETMTALGLPDFGPVQNNMSFNLARGATRGIHTEPWDKFVSIAVGRAFCAWVDMREGDSFGATYAIELDPHTAVFVPRGVGNSYQVLEDGTLYSYLVNDHYRPGTTYPALALDDPTAAIAWPIPLAEAEISAKDQRNPTLEAAAAMPPRRLLVTGCNGQLGRALMAAHPDAVGADLPDFDAADPAHVAGLPWPEIGAVVNAAGYTAVDAAETPEGRVAAWRANAVAPAVLAAAARDHGVAFVHFSTDYVFDGTAAEPHVETEPLSPLGVYAQSKAAGEIAAEIAPRHYVLRTSWVIGEGHNFVRTMRALAEKGVSPSVVDDQVGRLTFTSELVRATDHLLATEAAPGVYHVSNGGPATSWCDVAREVFIRSGRSADDVSPVSTEAYVAGQSGSGKLISPRPLMGVLALDKIQATGFTSRDALDDLDAYLA